MHCPKCGVSVMENAGFCHKCGASLDANDKQAVVNNYTDEPQQASRSTGSEPNIDRPARTPAEKFRENTTGGSRPDDEPENELWEGGYSPKAMLGAWVLSGLISIVLIVFAVYMGNGTVWIVLLSAIALLWLFQLIKLCFRRMNIRYRLTTQRFIHETGILRRVTDRIEVIDMDDIRYEQSFIERFVGVGTIHISSSDRTDPELVMPGIESVKKVAGMIDDIRRAERRRRGLHIESI